MKNDNENVEKYSHKEENHYSRATWGISGPIWGFSDLRVSCSN